MATDDDLARTRYRELRELREAAMPLVAYLREHYNPHTMVTVSQDRVDLWTPEMGLPIMHEAGEVPHQD